MPGVNRIALVLALFVFAAASSIGLAQDEDHVTIIGWENAPGCTGTVYDGGIKASNASSIFDYRVDVIARAENDPNGNPRRSTSPPDCSGEKCECLLNKTIEVFTTDPDAKLHKSCILPKCPPPPGGSCTTHCDNAMSQCPDPIPADHCTCVIGVYRVTHYSDDAGATWFPMSPADKIAITVKERSYLCPNPGAPCDVP